MFRKLRAMLSFSRQIQWVDEPQWDADDAKIFESFMATGAGRKFGRILLNMTLKTNASCVSRKKNLEFEAGFANGFRGAVSVVESLADGQLHRELEDEDDLELPENKSPLTFDDLYRR